MAISGKDLGTSFGINAALCLVFLGIFSFLRVRKPFSYFYSPKRHDPLWPRGRKPPRLAPSPLAWMPAVLRLHEDEVMRVAGMDAVAYVRLLQYGWTVFAFATAVCCVILFPVYGTGGVVGVLLKGGAETISDLDVVSLSNVPSGSPRMVAQLLVLYVVAWFALMLLLWYSRDISGLRARFMSTLPRGGPSHTVLYTDVPGVKHGTLGANPVVSKIASNPVADKVGAFAKRGSSGGGGAGAGGAAAARDAEKAGATMQAELPAEVLDPWLDAETALARDPAGGVESLVRREAASTYGPGEVAAVHAVYDTAKLDALVRQYDATKTKLEGVYEGYAVSLRAGKPVKKRKTVSVLPTAAAWAKTKYGVTGAKPVKVDALDYLPEQLEHLKREIDAAAPAARGADAPRLPAAFVTFNSRKTATVASTSLHSLDETCWRAQPAPGSDEILWANLGLRHWQVVVRTLLMTLAFVGLLLLYLPVTAFVQAFVNLDNVSRVPGLGVVTRLPFVTQILKGILPSLVLKIFLALLPPVLAAMARFSGAKSVSRVDLSVVSNFFVFQVFAVFLYQTIGGSGLGQLQQIIDNPSVLVKMLGVAIPQQASFFMSFIAIGAAAAGGSLLRIVGLVIFVIKLKLFGTERARYAAWKPQAQASLYGTALPNHTIVLLLGLTFCCVSPLIAPFCLLYFSTALLAHKYLQTWVVTHPYEAQGQMWTNCFNQVMTGIYFMIVVNICLSLVKSWPWILFSLPLLVAAVVLHGTALSLFRRPWSLMSLKEAAELDARDGSGGVSPAEAQQAALTYLSPSFKVDAADHARAIAQARAVDGALKAAPSGAAGAGAGQELDLGQDMGPFVDQGPEWEAAEAAPVAAPAAAAARV